MRGEAVVVLLAAAAAAAAVLVTAAEELDGLGDDLDGLALGAVLRLPLAPVEAAVDADRAALGQEAGAVLALGAPDGDAEVVGLVDPLARLVTAPRIGRDAQAADRRAGLQRPKLRVAREVPGENHAIDVACRHFRLAPFQTLRTCGRVYVRFGGTGRLRRFLRRKVTVLLRSKSV